MARKNSRTKGSNAELEVCRLLSSWWDGVDRSKVPAKDLPFFRTPGSGGWASSRSVAASEEMGVIAGDVSTTHKDFPFLVEIKRREVSIHFENALSAASWPVYGWWDQIQAEASRYEDRIPMLLFRQNRKPWHAMVREPIARSLFPDPKDRPIYLSVNVDPWNRLAVLRASDILSVSAPLVVRRLEWLREFEQLNRDSWRLQSPEKLNRYYDDSCTVTRKTAIGG